MIITYTHAHTSFNNFFFWEKINRKTAGTKERYETKGKGGKALLTDAHSWQDEIIVRATTDRDEWLGLYKIDAAQRAIARLQTPKERPLHGIRIILVKGLR